MNIFKEYGIISPIGRLGKRAGLKNGCNMKVGIIYKREKVKDGNIIKNLVEGFKSRGAEAVVLNGYDELKNLDVALVLGGDGAILHSAVPASKTG